MKLDIQRFAVTFTGKEATGNYSWAKIQGRVICEETYVGTSTENKSTVKCTVQARVTTGGTTAANWRAGVTIGDDEKTGKLATNTKFVDSWQTIKEFTFDVPHDEDGSKVVTISGYAQAPEYATSLGDAKSTFSGEMKLTTIPRESSISVNKETATLGDTIRVSINRKSSSFSENLAFILSSPDTGSQNVEAVGVSETYYDYVITEETYKYLTGTQGFLTISGTTLDENDKVVASTNTVSVEILTPNSMIPSVEIGDLYENGSIVPSSWGVFVKGKSEIGIPVTSTGINGSTIKNISMKDSNDSGVYVINSSSGIFSTNKVKANGTLTITATDTRGKSASDTVEYEIVDYANPILSTYSAKKVNSEGAEDDNGQYIMFSIGGTISSCGGNNVKKLYVAVNNQTNWISVADDTVDAILSDITIDPNVKNTVYFKIEDSLGGSEIKSVPIDSAFRLMNFNKTLTSIALGKKSSAADNEELLEVNMKSKFFNNISLPQSPSSAPIGLLFGENMILRQSTDGDTVINGNRNLYLRPNGNTEASGQAILDTNGSLTLSQNMNAKGYLCEKDARITPIDISDTTATLLSRVKSLASAGTKQATWFTYSDGSSSGISDKPTGSTNAGFVCEAICNRYVSSSDWRYILRCFVQSNLCMYLASIDNNTTSITWYKQNTFSHPVGSVFITSTNTNPNTLGLPGTWTLIDKEFSPVNPVSSGFTNDTTNTTSNSNYWSRSGHSINYELQFVNKVQLNDTAKKIGQINLATLGISRFAHTVRPTGYTDGGNCCLMMEITTTGVVNCVDIIPDSYISVGQTNVANFTQTIPMEYMLDSACDKFYWKRVS